MYVMKAHELMEGAEGVDRKQWNNDKSGFLFSPAHHHEGHTSLQLPFPGNQVFKIVYGRQDRFVSLQPSQMFGEAEVAFSTCL